MAESLHPAATHLPSGGHILAQVNSIPDSSKGDEGSFILESSKEEQRVDSMIDGSNGLPKSFVAFRPHTHPSLPMPQGDEIREITRHG